METTIKREMLRHHAGREMFCPLCQKCLDAPRAVELDFMDDSGNLAASRILCATCYDAQWRERIAAVQERKPGSIEVNDGRILFARAKRTKKVEAG